MPGEGVRLKESELYEMTNKEAITSVSDAMKLANHYAIYRFDITNGIKYWKIAANLGSAIAAYNVGQCYSTYSNIYDPEEAEHWYAVAVKLGYTNAAEKIKELHTLHRVP